MKQTEGNHPFGPAGVLTSILSIYLTGYILKSIPCKMVFYREAILFNQ